MSIFEITMLVCFGAAWPLSIYKTWSSRKNSGKSWHFLVVVIIGYVAGALHKVIYNWDAVFYLYVLNGLMVSVDLVLYARNARIARAEEIRTL